MTKPANAQKTANFSHPGIVGPESIYGYSKEPAEAAWALRTLLRRAEPLRDGRGGLGARQEIDL